MAVLPTPGSPRSTSTPLCPARAPSSRPPSAARSVRRSSSITCPTWRAISADSATAGFYATCPQLTAPAAGRQGGVRDSSGIAGLDGSGNLRGRTLRHPPGEADGAGQYHHAQEDQVDDARAGSPVELVRVAGKRDRLQRREQEVADR